MSDSMDGRGIVLFGIDKRHLSDPVFRRLRSRYEFVDPPVEIDASVHDAIGGFLELRISLTSAETLTVSVNMRSDYDDKAFNSAVTGLVRCAGGDWLLRSFRIDGRPVLP